MIISKVVRRRPWVYGAACALVGYQLGIQHEKESARRVVPKGFPRSCAVEYESTVRNSIKDFVDGNTSIVGVEAAEHLTGKQQQLPRELADIVGPSSIDTNHLLKGARIGKGIAYCVVSPNSLAEAVKVLQTCANANVAVIPMGKNTSLTGGATPRNEKSNRPTVVINMSKLKKIQIVGDKQQVLCLAGAGIYDLAQAAKAIERESHSILGSWFLNPTVAAGVAYGSGGTQIRKGPAYTERALWCEIDEKGKVAIRNTLGIKAANDDELFKKIESGSIAADDIDPKFAHVPASSSSSYSKHVCVLDGNVSRFNADTSGIEPCRSEGKVLILATLHDTFPEPRYTKTLWVSCNSLEEAQQLKREVLLNNPADLPVACEYMDRDSFDVVDSAGRFLCHAISKFGIGSSLEKMWNLKLKVESIPLPKFDVLPDKILYHLNNILPKTLPDKVYSLGKLYNHHLIVTLGEYGDGNVERTEKRLQEFCDKHGSVYVHECEKSEVPQITFFRFAAAPAFKTYCQGTNTQGLSIDYALAKNNFSKPEFRHLQGSDVPIKRMRYSHFGCNVVHEDICFPNSTDVEEVKMKIKAEIESEGGKLPAEHGHGTEYKAPQATQERWQRMDKLNIMNPGVGGTSYFEKYRKEEIL